MVVAGAENLVEVPPVIDDAALLDGAARMWAVISLASELPATPEHRTALAQARQRVLDEMQSVGLSEAVVVDYLRRGCANQRGRPRLHAVPLD